MSGPERSRPYGVEFDQGRTFYRHGDDEGSREVDPRHAHISHLQRSLGNAALGRAALQFKTKAIGSEGLQAAAMEFLPPPEKMMPSESGNLPQSGGQALPVEAQEELKHHAGTELHDVQVFQGGDVDTALNAANAEAATQGTNVYLSSGVDPSTDSGKDTMIHELRHVAQNKRGETGALDGVGGDPAVRQELERDADRR